MSSENNNTGYRNTGDCNTGNGNTGNYNTGNGNTGYRNTGDRNTGYFNTGDCNTGDYNTGNGNTGYRNTGNWNTGYFNTGDCNTGYFCTSTPGPTIFDTHTTLTHDDLVDRIYDAMPRIPLTEWINSEDMTDEDRAQHPEHKTTGGYLKSYGTLQEAGAAAWSKLTPDEQAEHEKKIRDLPNFDADKFLACTGIDLTGTSSDSDGKPKVITIDGVEYHRKETA